MTFTIWAFRGMPQHRGVRGCVRQAVCPLVLAVAGAVPVWAVEPVPEPGLPPPLLSTVPTGSLVDAVEALHAESIDLPLPRSVLEQGAASYYANRFHGRRTASGERYDRRQLTAAHKTLPFGTEVIVRSLRTGREVVVRIIDRGPHLKSRIIDLSHAAAEALGIRRHGVSEVQLIEKPATPQP
ncbi:septal ring lytic transglycosylase RlpA family protein [Macromonas nakdongensis]|uniref:septal ring lytic transglycosylase RlpA family protein n=1 Tax=Macromonas nakdongensis TaxID=1843082 RepID=UPI001E326E5B|nr:septal ring lytic transglycosylase RlpA family protein [Macromonas nakdongensis]